jgi:hypothetical protein
VGVPLFRRGLDGEQPHGDVVQPAAPTAEAAAAAGLEREMTPKSAVAVEVDEPATTRALAHPVAVIAARR